MGEDDDRELFEAALASIKPRDVFRGKYGSADNSEASPDTDDAPATEDTQRLRELVEMERAFAAVQKIDRGNVRAVPPRDHLTERAAADLRSEFEAALAPPPPEETKPPPPRRTLEEEAGDDVHTLNLRGMDHDRALGKLALFVDLASKDRRDLIRLRIGSDPGLLEIATSWLQGAGNVYVREMEVAQELADAAIFARIRHSDAS